MKNGKTETTQVIYSDLNFSSYLYISTSAIEWLF